MVPKVSSLLAQKVWVSLLNLNRLFSIQNFLVWLSFLRVYFSWEGVGTLPKRVLSFLGPMTSYIVMENHKQNPIVQTGRYNTNRHPVTFKIKQPLKGLKIQKKTKKYKKPNGTKCLKKFNVFSLLMLCVYTPTNFLMKFCLEILTWTTLITKIVFIFHNFLDFLLM